MPKTIKVRIPAVVSPDGKWCAYGYPGAMQDPDWSMVEEVADNGEPCYEYKRLWITAELVLPEVTEIEALAVEPHE
jgi:hypothetical protein